MSTIQSLWPDNPTEHAGNAPVALLREQAEALATATQNKLRARVETIGYTQNYGATMRAILADIQPQFRHRVVIVVPSLENYELEILNLYQGIEAYPVVAESKASTSTTLRDQDALIGWLKGALGSEATKKTLSTLLSLAA